MIDTFNIYTKSPDILENFDLNQLDNCVELIGKYGNYYKGFIGTYEVTYSTINLSLKGSLTKFLLGTNVQNMNRIQITEALNELEMRLGFRIGGFRVSRIDLGVTFEMSSIVPMYLESLIEIPKYKVVIYGNETKSFINNRKTITFYDKVVEFNKKKSGLKLAGMYIN
nr:hypothetical protein [Candidatus Cloacimonadota bacterium]